MPSFLFVCLANQIRSPIAAATFLSAWLALPGAKPCRVASAGTWTRSGMPVSPAAMAYAATFGIDLRHFRTTSIEQVKLAEYDYIIVMEKGQQEALSIEHPQLQPRIHLLAALAGCFSSDIPDPAQVDRDTAINILQDMRVCVQQIALHLCQPNPPGQP